MSNSIYLVGFMGSGKSTVGRRLAEALGWTFVDLDDDIEAATGRTIADIFSNDGEQAFRDAEHAALQARVSGSNAVVALGGGAFTFVRNRDVMKGAGRAFGWIAPSSWPCGAWKASRTGRWRRTRRSSARCSKSAWPIIPWPTCACRCWTMTLTRWYGRLWRRCDEFAERRVDDLQGGAAGGRS